MRSLTFTELSSLHVVWTEMQLELTEHDDLTKLEERHYVDHGDNVTEIIAYLADGDRFVTFIDSQISIDDLIWDDYEQLAWNHLPRDRADQPYS